MHHFENEKSDLTVTWEEPEHNGADAFILRYIMEISTHEKPEDWIEFATLNVDKNNRISTIKLIKTGQAS